MSAAACRALLLILGVSSAAACAEPHRTEPEDLTSHQPAGDAARGAACDAEPVPDVPGDYFRDIEFGDDQIMHRDLVTLERSLSTGEIVPLFEVQRQDGKVALDERDIFTLGSDELYRFNRSTRQFSLFAPDTTDLDLPAARQPHRAGLALSETHVVSLIDTRSGGASHALEVIERSSGERRWIQLALPVARPRLHVHAGRFFLTNVTELGNLAQIYAYDLEAGTAEPISLDHAALDYAVLAHADFEVRFWEDSLLVTITGAGIHESLVRVPLSGGESEILATALESGWFTIARDEVFVLNHDGSAHGRLTAIDLRSGQQRAIGSCDGIPFHASAGHLYAYTDRLGVLRLSL